MARSRDKPLHFDAEYCEPVRLTDDSQAMIRLIRPSDRDALLHGFEQLSEKSRYLRFFMIKATLNDRELAQLVNVDGVDHLALVAFALPVAEREEGLGVARFVRLPDRPDAAEAAVTVIDHAQGKGLASHLVTRLAAAAHERGIDRFVCEFLATNRPLQHLLDRYARDAIFEHDGYVTRADFQVPTADSPGWSSSPARVSISQQRSATRRTAAFELLRDSARGAIEVRLRHLLLKSPGKRD